MPCHEMQSWTFSKLVGAFLDLGITCLLLCGSALAYFASKFLGLFGLFIPCTCNGRFGDDNGHDCWQRLLVERPSKNLSSIQFDIKNRLPFDSLLARNANSQLASNMISRENEIIGVEDHMPRSLFNDISEIDEESAALPSGDVNDRLIMGSGQSSAAPTYREGISSVFNEQAGGEFFLEGKEEDKIKKLRRALQKERTVNASLNLELEKERTAAATAVDETMGMILRLQEEKAVIEMEAMQYRRMIEEKSAYDQEEMNILKEILIRREKEKYFLQKEVEAHRQLIFRTEQHEEAMSSFEFSGGDTATEHGISSIRTKNYSLSFAKEFPMPDADEAGLFKELDDSDHLEKVIDESPTLDAHIVDDNINTHDQDRGDYMFPCQQEISRSCSDVSGLPKMGFSKRKLFFVLERNSMSAVDYEREKIDGEVGWLRGRLKIVQEGREKLNVALEDRQKEKIQFQVSDNLISQLRDMRQYSEPCGNKVAPMRIRCTSVSIRECKEVLQTTYSHS